MVYPLQGWVTCPACGDATSKTTVSLVATTAMCSRCGAKLAIPGQPRNQPVRNGFALIVGNVRVVEPGAKVPVAAPARPGTKRALLVFFVLLVVVGGGAFLLRTRL